MHPFLSVPLSFPQTLRTTAICAEKYRFLDNTVIIRWLWLLLIIIHNWLQIVFWKRLFNIHNFTLIEFRIYFLSRCILFQFCTNMIFIIHVLILTWLISFHLICRTYVTQNDLTVWRKPKNSTIKCRFTLILFLKRQM